MITLQLARKADECSAKTEVFSLAINKTSGGLYYNRPFDPGPLMTAVVNAHSRLRGAISQRILSRISSECLELVPEYRNRDENGNKKHAHRPLTGKRPMGAKGFADFVACCRGYKVSGSLKWSRNCFTTGAISLHICTRQKARRIPRYP